MRKARKVYANAIIAEFQKDLESIVGKDVDIKKWIADNHQDRKNHPDYNRVDSLRQNISNMQKYVLSMDDSPVAPVPLESSPPVSSNPNSQDTQEAENPISPPGTEIPETKLDGID